MSEKQVSAEQAFDTLIVAFEDQPAGLTHRYRSKPMTRSGRKQFRELQAEIEKVSIDEEISDDDRDDRMIKLTIAQIAICVTPLDTAPPDVKGYLEEKWEADELEGAYVERVIVELSQVTGPFSGMNRERDG